MYVDKLDGRVDAVFFDKMSAEWRAEHPVIPLSLFKNRNFVLTTTAGLAMAVAMFGVVGYLPTYFQMAEGVSATEAGLLMVPLMGSLLFTSVVIGAVVSKTGRYKVIPIIGLSAHAMVGDRERVSMSLLIS